MCDRRSRKKVPWEKGPALRSSLSSEVEHARGIMCGLHTCLFWCGRTKTVSVITRGVSRGKSSPVFGFAQSCHFSNVIPRAPAGGRISPKSTGVKSRQNCYNLTNILTIIINMLIRNQMIVCLISMSKWFNTYWFKVIKRYVCALDHYMFHGLKTCVDNYSVNSCFRGLRESLHARFTSDILHLYGFASISILFQRGEIPQNTGNAKWLHSIPVSREKNTPPDEKALWSTSLKSTTSGGGEQFLPLAVSAAVLQGKGSHKVSVFSETPVSYQSCGVISKHITVFTVCLLACLLALLCFALLCLLPLFVWLSILTCCRICR